MLKLFIPIGVSLALISGCKNTSPQDNNLDAGSVASSIEKNKTTLSEARLYLGEPAFVMVTEDGKKIAGFNLVNKAFTEDFSNNIIKGTMSFGQKSTLIPKMTKNVFLELDDNNVVTNYKFAGAAWVEKKYFFIKNEARITLDLDEILNKNEFTAEYIYNKHLRLLAQNKNNKELNENSSTFVNCEYKCQLYKNANDLYGTLYKLPSDSSQNLPGQNN
jgi:hypothetical protein